MGLTIHYSGIFKKTASLKEMMDETEVMVKSLNWDYHLFNHEFPPSENYQANENQIYGIWFTPPKCETVQLSFKANRMLGWESDPEQVQFFSVAFENGQLIEIPLRHGWNTTYCSSTKTQYAGPIVHMKIVDILKVISAKYIDNFEVYDESNYYEDQDREALFRRFGYQLEI
jgi:hypothetical protein